MPRRGLETSVIIMPEQKIQGKFYPLKNDEWVRACKHLTKSQLAVLYYLRSQDPYSIGIRIKASKIAQELGITKRSVNAAIAFLEEKEYIDLQDIEYSVKVSAGGCLCDSLESGTGVGNRFPTGEENFPPEKSISHQGKEFPTGEENFPPEKSISHSQAETQSQQSSCNSKINKINKTYLDFKDSLSEEERESFLEFGLKLASQLPRQPQLPLKWVEKNWEDLRIQWEKSQGRVSSVKSSKWENHPQREEWLEKIRHLGPVGFQAEDMPNQKMRREFYMWANANKLVWGEMES